MTSPRRIYTIYHTLCREAETVRDFELAAGRPAPGTVERLIRKDRGKLLRKWAEEMDELCGVIDGSHDDPYLMEASQTFYWATLFAVTADASWDAIAFDAQRRAAAASGITSLAELRAACVRLAGIGAEAKAEKPFLLWCVADSFYRAATPLDKQWSIEQVMAYDFADMMKRPYLKPIIDRTAD